MRMIPSLVIASMVLPLPMTGAVAQSLRQKALPMRSNATPRPAWDNALAGQWTYRSYLNDPSVLVNADPDPAVQALSPIYGSDNVANATAALKALNLIFGEGIITFDPPAGNALTGNLDMGGGLVLDLKGTMQSTPSGDIGIVVIGTGRAGTKTDGWEYDYNATTAPKWPNGVDQVPTLVGTVIRAKPHNGEPAGVVASFIAIKH
jgi:hypothetical protein